MRENPLIGFSLSLTAFHILLAISLKFCECQQNTFIEGGLEGTAGNSITLQVSISLLSSRDNCTKKAGPFLKIKNSLNFCPAFRYIFQLSSLIVEINLLELPGHWSCVCQGVHAGRRQQHSPWKPNYLYTTGLHFWAPIHSN